MAHLITRIRHLLPSSPIPWLAGWIVWLITLWFLSEKHPSPKQGPEIPHLDKVAHFGYFMGGAILLTSFLQRRTHLAATSIFMMVSLAGAAIGALDEYHQTFTPGRSGNDLYDWLADFSGTITGALIVITLLHNQKPTGKTR